MVILGDSCNSDKAKEAHTIHFDIRTGHTHTSPHHANILWPIYLAYACQLSNTQRVCLFTNSYL